ncbi:MAG: ABC transporter permease [Armatimonadetes bacterium]|nr:ABC transporter permease [Armatimonadota bacterium]
MLQKFVIIALRNIRRQKFYSILNILGLAIGVTCCMLIVLYIQTELSYDNFYDNADRIFRLNNENDMGGKIDKYCNAPRPISPTMKEIYPEILESTRVCGVNGLYTHRANLYFEEKAVLTDQIFAVDSTFFDVFNNEFIEGCAEEAFSQQNAIIISESLAKRIFGDEDPYQKTISIENAFDLVVTAVFKDLPGRTHFPYEALIPWIGAYRPGEENVWYGWQVYHYFLLEDDADPADMEAKFPEFYETYMKETYDRINGHSTLSLQPLKSIRLHSKLVWEMYPNGDIANLYIFSIIAVFLLLIACINYINLATARSVRRSREVGLRKVFGSQRGPLINQFLVESVLMSLTGAFLALVAAELLLPAFNSITSLDVKFNLIQNLEYLFGTFLLGLFIGIVAGIYPAFFLSRFNPVHTLKSDSIKGVKGALFRKVLIIVQFSISIAMIIGTLLVIKQLLYAKNKDLGFNKEYVMAVTIRDQDVENRIQTIKQELTSYPNIISAAISFNMPGTTFNRSPATVENNEGAFEQASCQFMQIDYEYIETMEMEIVEGRNFSRDHENSWIQSVLVNQAAVKKFGWDEPIGKRVFNFEDSLGTRYYLDVVGVVKDFHPNSVRQELHPILIYLITDDMQYRYRENLRLFIRIKKENLSQTVGLIRDKWNEYDPDDPMRYVFVDEQLDSLYRAEEKLITLFGYFTFITIFIACLGLFGLASFTAEQRTKEIGIRKVLGSSILQITCLLSKDYAKLILLSCIIACPVAYWAMSKWLQNFAYRTGISYWIFLVSGGTALLIALITVSVQTIKAANTNPVEALKYE